MNKKSPVFAFFAIFLGWFAFKKFDLEAFRFKEAIGYLYLLVSLVAGYFYFRGTKKEEK
jgi:hypothetical protein